MSDTLTREDTLEALSRATDAVITMGRMMGGAPGLLSGMGLHPEAVNEFCQEIATRMEEASAEAGHKAETTEEALGAGFLNGFVHGVIFIGQLTVAQELAERMGALGDGGTLH